MNPKKAETFKKMQVQGPLHPKYERIHRIRLEISILVNMVINECMILCMKFQHNLVTKPVFSTNLCESSILNLHCF